MMTPSHSSFQESFPCPYFKDGREATYDYLVNLCMTRSEYGKLLSLGFRRSGYFYYRTRCINCADCIPLRVDISQFSASKSQRRILRQNSDIQVRIIERPFLNQEKIDMYSHYLEYKHNRKPSGMSEESLGALIDLHYGYEGIIEVDYLLTRKLIAVSIIDAADNALSANYFYYDTEHLDRHPGVFSILREIALAGTLGMRFYYLGFYIKGTQKMSYKKYFRPNQIFRNGIWEPLPV